MQISEILLLNQPVSVFAYNNGTYKPNSRVVVAFNDCLELGVVKGNVDAEQNAEIIRNVTAEDNKKNCENCAYARSILPEIKKEAQNQKLDMKIGFISISLDKAKLTISYTADARVDFRDLIKVLANKYKVKIEMRQIGNRDETKVVGAMGVCGREVCCKAYFDSKRADGKLWCHFPKCFDINCPLLHPELLEGAKLEGEIDKI